MEFLNNLKVLYQKQFGFQKNFYTAPAIITFIENIKKAINNKLLVCGIIIDLQKAIDTIDHNTLLHKLHHFGIRDLANNWFSSYLSVQQGSV